MRDLIVKIASETGWGYTRVLGELKKLGIKPPSRTTVKNILKEHNLEPGPMRGHNSWDDFIKRHAETLWECDFFSKRIWTKSGLRQCFVLIFLHVSSRRVFVSSCTQKTGSAWMTEQEQKFVKLFDIGVANSLKALDIIEKHNEQGAVDFNRVATHGQNLVE